MNYKPLSEIRIHEFMLIYYQQIKIQIEIDFKMGEKRNSTAEHHLINKRNDDVRKNSSVDAGNEWVMGKNFMRNRIFI